MAWSVGHPASDDTSPGVALGDTREPLVPREELHERIEAVGADRVQVEADLVHGPTAEPLPGRELQEEVCRRKVCTDRAQINHSGAVVRIAPDRPRAGSGGGGRRTESHGQHKDRDPCGTEADPWPTNSGVTHTIDDPALCR
jgi:hypothetical protein